MLYRSASIFLPTIYLLSEKISSWEDEIWYHRGYILINYNTSYILMAFDFYSVCDHGLDWGNQLLYEKEKKHHKKIKIKIKNVYLSLEMLFGMEVSTPAALRVLQHSYPWHELQIELRFVMALTWNKRLRLLEVAVSLSFSTAVTAGVTPAFLKILLTPEVSG